jgi:hypothetical protein
MAQTISRMYGSIEQANNVVAELANYGFREDVYVVTRTGSTAAGVDQPVLSVEAITTAIMKAFVIKSDARLLAEAVRRGGVLVVVHAPFGAAVTAIELMDEMGPIPSGLPDPVIDYLPWDDGAPLSSALHMPILTEPDASLSTFFGCPTLVSSQCALFGCIGVPALGGSAAPLSNSTGMPLLSSKAAPLSSLFGLPLLI